MGVPTGGSGAQNAATAYIIVDAKGVQQAVPIMTGFGQTVEDVMASASKSIAATEAEMRKFAAEAQKAVVTERGRQQRLSEGHAKRADIARANARADAQMRIDDNRAMNEQIVNEYNNSSKQIIASTKATSNETIAADKNAAKERMQTESNLTKWLIASEHDESKERIAAANNVSRQQIKAAELTEKSRIESAKNASKVEIAEINLVRDANNAASRVMLEQDKHDNRVALENIKQTNRMQLQGQRGVGGRAGNLLNMLGLGGIGGLAVKGGAITFGVQMVMQQAQQVGQAAADMERLATAYQRQTIAARQLAGGTGNLNKLLQAYNTATQGAVNQSTAMADVTRLQAIGFADSAGELEEFVKAARGISIAMGRDMADVTQEMALAIANLSTRRLDQLGLGVGEVNERIEELRDSNANMTREMAFSQAVIGIATEKFGILTTDIDAQVTGVERLTASWHDLGLELSQILRGPINAIADWVNTGVDAAVEALQELQNAREEDTIRGNVPGGLGDEVPGSGGSTSLGAARVNRDIWMQQRDFLKSLNESTGSLGIFDDAIRRLDEAIAQADITIRGLSINKSATDLGPGPYGGGPEGIDYGAPRDKFAELSREQWEVLFDAEQDRAEMEEGFAKERADVSREYEEQRTRTIADYELQIAREAEDFARQRLRDQEDHQEAMNEVVEEGLRRQQEMVEDYNRQIARNNRDAADRISEIEEDYNKRVGDLREDSADKIAEWEEDKAEKELELREESQERISEMEEEYQRDREKALRDYHDNITEAAANLDAGAVWQAQRRFAREEKEAADSHKRKVEKEKEKLEEAIQEVREAHEKRIKEEKASLEKSIAEATERRDEAIEDENKALLKRNEDARIAHAEQLKDAKDKDEQRLIDMQTDFDKRIEKEDADRLIRMGRLQIDHDNQLKEMDRVHGLRMTQIGEQEAEAREKFNNAYTDRLADAGIYNTAWMLQTAEAHARQLKAFKKFFAAIDKMLGEDVAEVPDAVDPIVQQWKQELLNKRSEAVLRRDKAQTPAETQAAQAIIDWIDAFLGGSGGVTLSGAGGEFLPGKIVSPPPVGGIAGGLGGTANITIESGAIVVNAAPGQSLSSVGEEFERRLLDVLQKVAAI